MSLSVYDNKLGLVLLVTWSLGKLIDTEDEVNGITPQKHH